MATSQPAWIRFTWEVGNGVFAVIDYGDGLTVAIGVLCEQPRAEGLGIWYLLEQVVTVFCFLNLRRKNRILSVS